MTKGLEKAGAAGAAEGGSGGGHGAVPDMSTLPAPMREIVEHAYGVATADLFLVATPFALLALVAVVFIKEKPLKTTSGMERLAEEAGEAPGAGISVPAQRSGDAPSKADSGPASPVA